MNSRVYKALRKQAGAGAEFFIGAPAALIPYVGQAAGAAGLALGELEGSSHTKDEIVDELEGFEKNMGRALIPGVSGYRFSARKQLVEKLLENTKDKNRPKRLSRHLGGWLSVANPLNWVAAPIAALAAAATPTRELDEQAEYSNDPDYVPKSILIPGWGLYNALKAVGVSNKIGKNEYTDADIEGLDPETRKLLKKRMPRKRKKKD